MINKRSIFKELWRLQLDNYKKDLFNLFSGWIITLITLVVWLSFKDTSESAGLKQDNFVLASAIGVSCIRNCLFNFIRTIHDFKNKDFFNRLFSTKISKRFVFTLMILFNQVANLIVTILFFCVGMLYKDQRIKVADVNWLMFSIGYILLIIMCNLMAFIIAFTQKKLEWALVLGNITYFGAIFLLGLGIPYTTLSTVPWLMKLTFIIPQRYILNIMQAGWIDSPDFTIPNHDTGFGYNENAWIPYVTSVVWILFLALLLAFISVRAFEYENRKYKKYANRNKHLGIIYSIKRTQNLEELNNIISVNKSMNKSVKELTLELRELRKEGWLWNVWDKFKTKGKKKS
ncbi:hypothetical protein SCHIN_v1c08990 [Spiroplasma chinense]|uniref:Uncharacterized protein n=1 Tax=Spiroplasma chinense TaxID=216932 RepID=A0A5B9Y4T0_9MOLU|nr:ABC transporter permease [Spiroplasma chinense]QEH62094.1 hypothetical protein SCHIN_v1c08990 [Spiroplasma chinense]